MKRLGCIALLAGCSFQAPLQSAPADSNNAPRIDAAAGDDSGSAAAQTCFGRSLVAFCLTSPPAGALTVPSAVNTDSAGACTQVIPQAGATAGPDLCVIAAANLTVSGTVVATGPRVLVLVGGDTVRVSGTLDVSSRRGVRRGAAANGTMCAALAAGKNDSGGGGGGAGGSLGTKGGKGGQGDGNDNHPPDGRAPGGAPAAAQIPPALLRGGCPGGAGGDGAATDPSHIGGAGGDGGGAVYLIAGKTITIEGGGNVFASGAGGGVAGGPTGFEQGGGGGGSGGMVGLDAPNITVSGHIAANGGAGAGGGSVNGGTSGGDAAAVMWNMRAMGGHGDGNPQNGGGGDGADGTSVTGTDRLDGGDAQAAGGGGAGGLGIVWIDGALSPSGAAISPAPTLAPPHSS